MVKKLLIPALAVGGLLTTRAVASADHSWNSYHWPSDRLSPTVVDKTTASGRDFKIADAVAEWANLNFDLDGDTLPETTPITPQIATSGKGEVEVVVKKINASWLGFARISVDSAGHIQAGR